MAKNAKPNVPNLNPEVTPIYNGTTNTRGQTLASLIDGIQENAWVNSTVFYWENPNVYLDFTINTPVNIWRSGTASWSSYTSPFTILKYNETTKEWKNVTSTISQTTTAITNSQWEKTITNLPKGRYRFSAASTRIDSEWYIESFLNVKKFILQNSKLKYYDTTTNSWTNFNTTPTLSELETKGLITLTDEIIGKIDSTIPFKIVEYEKNNISDTSLLDINFKISPKPLTILMEKELILNNLKRIDNFKITLDNTGVNDIVKVLFSLDNGTTYNIMTSDNNLEVIPLTEIELRGMNLTNFNSSSLPQKLNTLEDKKIKLAIYMNTFNEMSSIKLNNIQVTGLIKDYYKKAIHGKDYDYRHFDNNLIEIDFLSNGSYKVNY